MNRSISVLYYLPSSKLDFNRCHLLPVQLSASKSKSLITSISLVSSLLVSVLKFLYFAAVTINVLPVVDEDPHAGFPTFSGLEMNSNLALIYPKDGNSSM